MTIHNLLPKKSAWGSTACLLAFLTNSAVAAPVIQQVSGTLNQNSTVTISGSGFGSKATAAPLRWDDFEAGAVGQALTGWDIGSTNADSLPKYVNKSRLGTTGSKSAHQHFAPGQYNSDIGIYGYSSRKFYVSGWVSGSTVGSPSRNVKLVGFRGGPPGDWDYPYGRLDQWPDNGGGSKYVTDCDGNDMAQDWDMPGLIIADGKWHRFETWIDLGTPNGNNGVYSTWKDTVEWGKTLKGTFIKSSGCTFTNVHIQAYYATDTGTNPGADYYWDELYVDTTRARVELGNAPTWAACTHREIQVPSAWSTNSIAFKVNKGIFSTGQQAYLFIVDENGNPSSGYPITIGGGAVSFSAPTNLRVTN